MTTEHEFIQYEAGDRIATITLNRPEAANAQTLELLDQLDEAWRRGRRRGARDRLAGQRQALLCGPRH